MAQNASDQHDFELAQSMETFNSAFIDLNMAYVDTLAAEQMLNNIMHGMLKNLDPYTEYIEPKDLQDFEASVTGKYGGIGALIRQRGEWTEISEPYQGTPSDVAGLRAGDRLVEIDGVELKGLGVEKVVGMLKGDPNTTFTLKYRPISDTNTIKTVEVHREIINLPAVPYYGTIDDSIGYIRLSSFTDKSSQEVENAYKWLVENHGIGSLIIDLRNNGGGVVGEVIKMINMFVPKGVTVLEMRGKIDEIRTEYKTRSNPLNTEIPLAVLINSSSASASEIFAGAMQDLDRGVVIGQRSFGKGLVQTTKQLPNDGLLKLTIARYYTPSGRCIQALDYTHKREDGSVGTIPDSLIQRFLTNNKREVFNGGGIMPDIKTKPQYISKFSAILMANGLADDFANIYAAQNPDSTNMFRMTEEIYQQFVDFMQTHNVKFESLSALKLEELRKIAKEEKYDSLITNELDAIAIKIKDDKNAELEKNKEELMDMLTELILTRLYYQKRAIEYSIVDDRTVRESIEILNNPEEYTRILTEQHTTKN